MISFKRITTIVSLVLITASFGYSDGCYVPKIAPDNEKVDLSEPIQEAIILHDNGREWLSLRVGFRGNINAFAWIVPTPSKPEVTKCYEGLFLGMHKAVAPRYRYWYDLDHALFDSMGMMAVHTTRTAPEEVDVLERRQVGIYDTSVLRAKNADVLIDWLKTNGYRTSDNIREVATDYIKRGWVFTAMKVTMPNGLYDNSGMLEPITLSFSTERPVYPLKISSLNSGKTRVRLFVVCNHRLDVEPLKTVYSMGPNRDGGAWQNAVWDLLSQNQGAKYRRIGDYVLTELEGELTAAQMKSDLYLHKSKSFDHIPYRYVSAPLWENIGAVLTIPLALAFGFPTCVLMIFACLILAVVKKIQYLTALLITVLVVGAGIFGLTPVLIMDSTGYWPMCIIAPLTMGLIIVRYRRKGISKHKHH